MADIPVHEGGCHCGAVRLEVRAPARPTLLRCNCSICEKTGFLHLIAPKSEFRLLSGEDQLVEYRFGSGQARHLFCRVCGVKSFYYPRSHPGGVSVHYGCLDKSRFEQPDIVDFDGRNWDAAIAGIDRGSA